jgi:DNA repair protein RAD57
LSSREVQSRNINFHIASMDLLLVLPGFVTKPFAHILPPLERAKVTTVDVITLDSLEIAKRARVPPADVRRLSSCIVEALHTDVGFEKPQTNTGTSDGPSSSINPDATTRKIGSTKRASQWNTISTLDPAMDALLGGGIPTGYVTEVTGERYVAGIHPSLMSPTGRSI